jgi:hypothetical protein
MVDKKEIDSIDKEINELQTKINEMKKGYEMTIHNFSKSKTDESGRALKKEKEMMKRLTFSVNKVIGPPVK